MTRQRRSWHISEELIGRFLRAETSKDESREVVRHLLGGCQECAERSLRAAAGKGFLSRPLVIPADWDQAYEEVFNRVITWATAEEQRLALEKLRGWAQWAYLEPLSPQVRFSTVEADASYQTYGLFERLLEASRWASRREPAEAVDIVRLAVVIAEHLDPAEIGEERVADLQAIAWANLGNARRIANDFEGARRAFNEAWRILEDGTGDAAERAELISFEASYMKAIGEFELAESTLEEAFEIYRDLADSHRQGRILFQMGDIIGHVDPERGLGHIRKALTLLDREREPRLDLCAQHDLALYLTESGRPREALAILERSRPLYEQFQDDLTQLRMHWLEGKIACRLGELKDAETIFSQLWEELRALNLHQEVVLVTIDLAEVLIKKGESARAAELSAECYGIMKNWNLHRDALSAWIVFQHALTHGRMAGSLFKKVGEYYRRHWSRPAKLEIEEG